jgi:cyclopropane-fatty-acyl-phospholipid synthase
MRGPFRLRGGPFAKAPPPGDGNPRHSKALKSALMKVRWIRPMDRFLEFVLSLAIRTGTLQVTTASGRSFTLGDGSGGVIAMRFASQRVVWRILLDPELHIGEAYVDGELVIEQGSIADLLDLIVRNTRGRPMAWARFLGVLRAAGRRALHHNSMFNARRNVAHHYDIDGRLYGLFLDADRQYSCAYFETPTQPLDDAQHAKKQHIATKLLIQPGNGILDIGSGWGGLGLHLAESFGATVTGVTLSSEQHALSVARARLKGLDDKVHFRLQDYRDVTGVFDRIVSIGMFEHVGKEHYAAFFGKCLDLLAEDGVMLLHTVGRLDGPAATNAWVWRYIFPGGYAPALSELTAAIERSGLVICDIEVLRMHYAETLRHWRRRFLAKRDEVLKIYDERFVRLWEFYLAGFEASFRHGVLVVFQIQLAKRIDAVPLTRNYLYGRLPAAAGGFQQAAE